MQKATVTLYDTKTKLVWSVIYVERYLNAFLSRITKGTNKCGGPFA